MASKKKFKFFSDILKEKGKYSQGRVYLLGSIIAYYITLGILTLSGLRKDEIEMENFKMIVDALEYAMTLFAGYVFGGKAIEVAKIFRAGRNEETVGTTNEDLPDERIPNGGAGHIPDDANNC